MDFLLSHLKQSSLVINIYVLNSIHILFHHTALPLPGDFVSLDVLAGPVKPCSGCGGGLLCSVGTGLVLVWDFSSLSLLSSVV